HDAFEATRSGWHSRKITKEERESSGYHSLSDPQLRLSGAGGTRADGGAGLFVDRAVGAACVAYAVAHLYAARDVGRIGRGESGIGGGVARVCEGAAARGDGSGGAA